MLKKYKSRNEENNYDEENELLEDFIIKQDYSCSNYIVNLDFELRKSNHFRGLYDILQNSNELDSILLRVNNDGGFTDILIQLCYYLLNTPAKTVAEVHSVASSASFVCLACDELIVNPFSTMMFHSSFFTSLSGNVDEVFQNNENEKNRLKLLLDELCTGFLTEEEKSLILSGKTYFFNADQIEARNKNRKISKLRIKNESEED